MIPLLKFMNGTRVKLQTGVADGQRVDQTKRNMMVE